jgi:hypothetical protein
VIAFPGQRLRGNLNATASSPTYRAIIMKNFFASLILAAVVPTTAIASPVTYACTFLDRSSNLSDHLIFVGADQLVIDDDADTVELRVANTVGTDKLKNWIFSNNDTYKSINGGVPERFVVDTNPEQGISGVVIRMAMPLAFYLSTKTGELQWTLTTENEVSWFKWKCSR